ncbi:E3 ORF-1 [Bovine adenovirus 10]|uniref:E3 ORF-1 n=1 Tax=Bovine adenovirus C serotype 10 TaxID=39788 RepID=Q8QVG4_ADEBA|nr:URF-1 [Bovine adenovirus 10]UZF96934.1 E3 ORF-1 [Bovine adenovirus 10]
MKNLNLIVNFSTICAAHTIKCLVVFSCFLSYRMNETSNSTRVIQALGFNLKYEYRIHDYLKPDNYHPAASFVSNLTENNFQTNSGKNYYKGNKYVISRYPPYSL